MDQVHSATEHRKGKHLSFEERVVIQTRLKDGWTPNRIAGELGCAPNTVRNEIKRGTVTLYRGNIFRYRAKVRQAARRIVKLVVVTMIFLKRALSSLM